jgi:hypothetical protein
MDDPSSWPAKDELHLDDFTYQALAWQALTVGSPARIR